MRFSLVGVTFFDSSRVTASKLLLVDGLGALLSAALLVTLPDLGVSAKMLQALAGAAVVMAVYSLSCSLMKRTSKSYLRVIATANSLYCLVTIAMMIEQRARLSLLGFSYFVLEILVISPLILLELRLAASNQQHSLGSFDKIRSDGLSSQ